MKLQHLLYKVETILTAGILITVLAVSFWLVMKSIRRKSENLKK